MKSPEEYLVRESLVVMAVKQQQDHSNCVLGINLVVRRQFDINLYIDGDTLLSQEGTTQGDLQECGGIAEKSQSYTKERK